MKFWEDIANYGVHTENALLIEDKDLVILLMYFNDQYEWITVFQCLYKDALFALILYWRELVMLPLNMWF